jgi:hypothetical protein
MPIGIETARNRMDKKLSRKISPTKREFPWYKKTTVIDDRLQVEVSDMAAATSVLQPTYYNIPVVVVNAPTVTAPAPEQEGAQAPDEDNEEEEE